MTYLEVSQISQTMSASNRLAQISNQFSGHVTADQQLPPSLDDPHSSSPIATYAQSSTGPRLLNKVAIITGCNSTIGIGIASAYQFAQNGCKAVYICDAYSSNLASHASQLSALYPNTKIHYRAFDAADEESVKNVVQEAVNTYGRLDVFFANAGISGTQTTMWSISAEEWNEIMRVNTLSVFLATKYAGPAMKKTSSEKDVSGGSIIATASVAGINSGAGSTPYSASKAAVISTMKTAAWQLGGTNIRCNSICPGLTETGMTNLVYDMARKRGTTGKIGQLNPTRRGAIADEMARVALFLASDEASYVNGQAWAVDGGLSASHPVMPGKIG